MCWHHHVYTCIYIYIILYTCGVCYARVRRQGRFLDASRTVKTYPTLPRRPRAARVPKKNKSSIGQVVNNSKFNNKLYIFARVYITRVYKNVQISHYKIGCRDYTYIMFPTVIIGCYYSQNIIILRRPCIFHLFDV